MNIAFPEGSPVRSVHLRGEPGTLLGALRQIIAASGENVSVTEWLLRQTERAMPQESTVPRYNVTLNISGGTFGQLYAAVESVQNVESRINTIGAQGHTDVAEALRQISQAVIDEPTLDEDSRRDLIDSLDDLTDQANQPSETRRPGRIKGAIGILAAAAVAGTKLHETWTAWAPTIQQLAPH